MSNYEQYYRKTVDALKQYIKENKKIPTEKVWNKIAAEKELLTSQTLSYLSGTKFQNLCEELNQNIQKLQ